MLKAGQTGQVVFTDYTADGLGVCRLEGCAVFVPNAIVGETCTIQVTKVGKTAAWGKLEQIMEPSVHRIPKACPYAKQCGGCQFWHMDYEEELRLKSQRVRDTLTRLGGVDPGEILILGAAKTESYRNKVIYQVSEHRGRIVAGFYQARTHKVIPVERCLIQPLKADQVKETVLTWMNKYHVSAYKEETGSGLIRHIYVRIGFVTGQVLICLTANGSTLPKQDELIEALNTVPGFTTLVLSINHKKGNTVLGDQFKTLYGPGTIEDVLCGNRFRLSPRSFYQVNRDQAERLYALAVEAADLSEGATVLDLYCGTGTITLALAARAGKAVGVEIVPQAIEDARENARNNNFTNVDFLRCDAGEYAARVAADVPHSTELGGSAGEHAPRSKSLRDSPLQGAGENLQPQVIVVDPPRKGLAPAVIDAMVRMAPDRIVYVSCDPATLARDVKLLSQQGYVLRSARAVDMFPRTAHVECVVSLSRK